MWCLQEPRIGCLYLNRPRFQFSLFVVRNCSTIALLRSSHPYRLLRTSTGGTISFEPSLSPEVSGPFNQHRVYLLTLLTSCHPSPSFTDIICAIPSFTKFDLLMYVTCRSARKGTCNTLHPINILHSNSLNSKYRNRTCRK